MSVVTVGALLVLLWVRLTGKPWRQIGYVRPRSWIGGIALGLVFGAGFKLVMKAVVMPCSAPTRSTKRIIT